MNDSGNFFKLIVESGLAWIWFVVLAIWGGTASYVRRVKESGMKFSVRELIGEWTISGLAGLLTGFICLEYNYSMYITFVLVAISGHAGGKVLSLIESLALRRMSGEPRKLDKGD
jgi:hypothetical protein